MCPGAPCVTPDATLLRQGNTRAISADLGEWLGFDLLKYTFMQNFLGSDSVLLGYELTSAGSTLPVIRI